MLKSRNSKATFPAIHSPSRPAAALGKLEDKVFRDRHEGVFDKKKKRRQEKVTCASDVYSLDTIFLNEGWPRPATEGGDRLSTVLHLNTRTHAHTHLHARTHTCTHTCTRAEHLKLTSLSSLHPLHHLLPWRLCVQLAMRGVKDKDLSANQLFDKTQRVVSVLADPPSRPTAIPSFALSRLSVTCANVPPIFECDSISQLGGWQLGFCPVCPDCSTSTRSASCPR